MHERRSLLLETLLEPVFIASHYLADDGRPLAEITATNRVKDGVDFQLRRCPYSGSRFEKKMNISALPGLSQQIKNVISDTITLRNAYLETLGDTQFTLLSFWRFARILDSFPVFMVRCRDQLAKESSVPARVSAMFKAAQGLHLAPEVMLLRGYAPSDIVNTDLLLQVIEEGGLYLDDTRACAGPPAMIKAFVESAVDGSGKELDDGWLESVLGHSGIYGLFEYANAVTSIFAIKILFEAESRLHVANLLENIQEVELAEQSETMLARFGVLRTHDTQTLNNVAENFKLICQMYNMKINQELKNSDRFRKMLILRNPRMHAKLVDKVVSYLLEYLMWERGWFDTFRQQQTLVLRTLGYSTPAPVLTSDDFSGCGYNVRDLLSHWLRVEVQNLTDKVVVKAGVSCEEFQLTQIA